jgi:ribosomal protein S18 acetylase RimI-like enzyme
VADKDRPANTIAALRLPQATALLVSAFRSDPFVDFVAPMRTRTSSAWSRLFAATIRYGQLFGEVHTTPALEGVAVWLPPTSSHWTLDRVVRSGLVGAVLGFGGRALLRLAESATLASKLHSRLAPGPHWHLLQLGVEPSCRGRGVARSLVEPVLLRADAAGLPCYLETHNPVNLPFYSKLGFTVVGQARSPGGLQIWAMRRAP